MNTATAIERMAPQMSAATTAAAFLSDTCHALYGCASSRAVVGSVHSAVSQVLNPVDKIAAQFDTIYSTTKAFQEVNEEYRETTKAPVRRLRRERFRSMFLHAINEMMNGEDYSEADFAVAVQLAWQKVLKIVLHDLANLDDLNRAARRAGGLARAVRLAQTSMQRMRQQRRSKRSNANEPMRLVISCALAPRAPQFAAVAASRGVA